MAPTPTSWGSNPLRNKLLGGHQIHNECPTISFYEINTRTHQTMAKRRLLYTKVNHETKGILRLSPHQSTIIINSIMLPLSHAYTQSSILYHAILSIHINYSGLTNQITHHLYHAIISSCNTILSHASLSYLMHYYHISSPDRVGETSSLDSSGFLTRTLTTYQRTHHMNHLSSQSIIQTSQSRKRTISS